jgi:hypothetical protein
MTDIQNGSQPPLSPEALAEMAKLGIVRVPTDVFRFREYRYTNLDDAIVQAKREQR